MNICIGHSPDSDDAFMFYGMTHGKVDLEGLSITHDLVDIETLNRRALAGDLEVSAISLAAYPQIADRYDILPAGASVGDDYGPIVVSLGPLAPRDLAKGRIAIPGPRTTSARVLDLYLREEGIAVPPERRPIMDFDKILPAVLAGVVEAGLLIHEGQLTYADEGASLVVDLGVWWKKRTGTPLVLGVNVVRRDLGPETIARISRVLSHSIAWALAHREEALDYAMSFGRGLPRDLTDRFVGMYVNHHTVDLGEDGRAGAEKLLGTFRISSSPLRS